MTVLRAGILGLAVMATVGGGSVFAADTSAWNPYAPDLADALRLDAPWTEIRDGAYGSASVLLHEPGAGPLYDFRRDGLPLGTGHLWSDSVWSVSVAGARPAVVSTGGVTSGASGGGLDFRSFAADTSGAVLDSRFFKGVEESYLRRLSFRTPRAPWTIGFDFDEQILHDFISSELYGLSETYPSYPSVPGDTRFTGGPDWEAKGRIARTTLWRHQPDGSRLRLSYERLRRHAVILPAFDLDRLEQWGDRVHFGWNGPAGGGELDVGAALNGSDLRLDRSSKYLMITSARQTARAAWRRDDGALTATFEAGAWRVSERGDAVWASGVVPTTRHARQDAEARLARSWQGGGRRLEIGGGFGWQRRNAIRPRLDATLEVPRLGWRLTLEHGGRAPRSDELGSTWSVATPTRTVRLLPNDDLDFEQTTRAAMTWGGRRFGLDLEAAATARRTRDGIGWLQEGAAPIAQTGGEEYWGRWANGVELDAWTAGLRAGRSLTFSGLWRLAARFDVRGWSAAGDEGMPLPVFLPPERSAALEVRWLHAYFHGDGILELGWDVEHRGEATDPWLPGTDDRIPALTLHHALVMFRLVGVDLGLSFRNILDNKGALSSGTLAVVQEDREITSGREMRWRLQWTLRR